MATNTYIACLTTHRARFNNLPAVLKSLAEQTVRPDEIIITVYEPEIDDVKVYIPKLPIKTTLIGVDEDTKVWKKFLFAADLLKPDTLILTVDDDMIYPRDIAYRMIELTFAFPGRPISGNKYWHNGLKCHCGCLSLVQPRHFAGWRKYYAHWQQLPSSDMFLTMLAAQNKYQYAEPPTDYAAELQTYNEIQPYTRRGNVQRTYEYASRLLGWI